MRKKNGGIIIFFVNIGDLRARPYHSSLVGTHYSYGIIDDTFFSTWNYRWARICSIQNIQEESI